MRRAHTVLTIVLGLALMVSVLVAQKTQRTLQKELHTVADANSVLRETLGNLTLAITGKDKQIDHLLRFSCEVPQEPGPNSAPVPRSPELVPAKPSNTTSIGAN